MATKYIAFEQAAKVLGVARDELIKMVSYGTIRAFRIQDQMKFRQRDIHGLRRIKKLLGRALSTAEKAGGNGPMADPDPLLWERFQKGEIIDFEALQDLADEEAFDPLDSLGESVFTEALASHGGSVDALLESMAEEPLLDSVKEEIRELAQELKGGQKSVPPSARLEQPSESDSAIEPAAQLESSSEPEPQAEAPRPGKSARVAPPEPFLEEDELEEGTPAIKMAVFIALLLLFGGILFWQLKMGETSDELPQLLTGQVKKIELLQVVTARGVLKALRQVEVSSGVRGVVESIEVKLGDQVIKEQAVVVRLKARQLEEAYDVAKSELEAKRAALKEAQINLQNAKNLITKEERLIKSGAEQQIRQAQTALDQAQSSRSSAQKRVAELADELMRIKGLSEGSEPEIKIKKLERDLAYARDEVTRAERKVGVCTTEQETQKKLLDLTHPTNKARLDPLRDNQKKAELAINRLQKEILTVTKKLVQATNNLKDRVVRAPISGAVTEIKVKIGDHVSPNGVLAVISDRSRMVVEVPVDETDILKIRLGHKASVSLDAYSERQFTGKVTRIATRGQKKAGTEVSYFPIDIELNGTVHGLRPGLTAFANITVNSVPDALVVPIEAVQQRKAKAGAPIKVVFAVKLDGEHTVARQYEVMTGLSDNQVVELSYPGGLKEGARILVGPYRLLEKLKDGDAIELVAPKKTN